MLTRTAFLSLGLPALCLDATHLRGARLSRGNSLLRTEIVTSQFFLEPFPRRGKILSLGTSLGGLRDDAGGKMADSHTRHALVPILSTGTTPLVVSDFNFLRPTGHPLFHPSIINTMEIAQSGKSTLALPLR